MSLCAHSRPPQSGVAPCAVEAPGFGLLDVTSRGVGTKEAEVPTGALATDGTDAPRRGRFTFALSGCGAERGSRSFDGVAAVGRTSIPASGASVFAEAASEMSFGAAVADAALAGEVVTSRSIAPRHENPSATAATNAATTPAPTASLRLTEPCRTIDRFGLLPESHVSGVTVPSFCGWLELALL